MDNQYFLDEMKELLKEDYDKFIATFSDPIVKALRINTLKANVQMIKNEIDLKEKTPFDENTYYIDEEAKLGKHPYHLAGCYYLQDPSATIVVNALDVKENDVVLDLCAAPGGKSTHILNKLNHTGFLFSNEYDHTRANTLLSNIERFSCDNYCLTNNTVEVLCPQLEGVCDKVVVDAPCSGASMFKKYPETVNEYNYNAVVACQNRQLYILDYAYQTLKQEGTLVYSTCTFNKIEDEQVIEKFLAKYPDMELVETGLTCGHPGFDEKGYTRRVWPFDKAEGHFVAKMIKHAPVKKVNIKTLPFSYNKLVEEFISENCLTHFSYTIIKDRIYITRKPLYDLKANIIRQGIMLGEIVKNRIEPHHHFFTAIQQMKQTYDIQNLDELNKFLTGESLFVKNIKGYVQIRYKSIPIGFGKGDGQQIKNKLPKGLRN